MHGGDMAHKAPGKHYRNGITIAELFKRFPDDKAAEEWFINTRWPDGVRCPHCGSDNVKEGAAHRTMPFRCNSCKKNFSAKTGTVMRNSKVGYQNWIITLYLVTTSLKGVSSMKLHRDLGVSQKTAWHMLNRIRESYSEVNDLFEGEIEADQAHFGGAEINKHEHKKLNAGRGAVGKTTVAGLKNRDTNLIKAQVVESEDKSTLQGFVLANTTPDTTVYTDEARAYSGLPRTHKTVGHGVGDWVRECAHTNGLESFWSMLKRGYMGTFHHISPKHLHRYIAEFAGRHNDRPSDTIQQMAHMVHGMEGKRLRYCDLIAGGPAYPPVDEVRF